MGSGKRMKYLIQGYYGYGNIGDDILLDVCIKQILKRDKDAEIAILKTGKDEVYREKLLSSLGVQIIPYAGRISLFTQMGNFDAFVFGGGSGLTFSGLAGFYYNWLASVQRLKIFWVGFGIEDPGQGKQYLKALFTVAACDRMWLRDSASADILGRRFGWFRNYSLTADLARLYQIEKSKIKNSKSGYLLLSWSFSLTTQYTQEISRKHFAKVASAVLQFCREAKIELIILAAMCNSDDSVSILDFRNALGENPQDINIALVQPKTVDEKIDLILDSKMLVSARLHPFVVAKLAGVPAVGYLYAKKVVEFNNSLTKTSALSGENLEGCALASAELLKNEYQNPSRLLEEAALKAKAEQNFDFIDCMRHEVSTPVL
jgi:polysaccharide pyruvyl transferase WcaK-like protein